MKVERFSDGQPKADHKNSTSLMNKGSSYARNGRQAKDMHLNLPVAGQEKMRCIKVVQLLYLNMHISANVYHNDTFNSFIRRVSIFHNDSGHLRLSFYAGWRTNKN